MKSLARIAAIAGNTFREALRDKVLLTLIVIAVLVTAAARVIPPLRSARGPKSPRTWGWRA